MHRLTARPGVPVAALIAVLTVATVYVEFIALLDLSHGASATHYVEHDALRTHEAILHARIGDPWRFRLLTEWGVDGVLRATRALGLPHPVAVAFLGFRMLQNALIFALGWVYYRRLGARRFVAAVGLALVAWSFTQALLHAGLAFNSYSDVAFYLLAALLIMDGRYAWIVPLTVLAALNRETAGLIPLMLLAHGWRLGRRTAEGRRAALLGAAALAAFGATIAIVRVAVGPADLILGNGHHPGFDMFGYNVFRGLTWNYLFQTLNVVPLLAVAALPSWPRTLRAFGLAIAPIWLLVHVFTGVLAESRLVLVPMVLVFVPGVLAALSPRQPAADQ